MSLLNLQILEGIFVLSYLLVPRMKVTTIPFIVSLYKIYKICLHITEKIVFTVHNVRRAVYLKIKVSANKAPTLSTVHPNTEFY